MRRVATTLLMAIATSMLAGCVYDPYTGTYVPCCRNYGYYGFPYYRYPPPYYAPYGYPPGPYGVLTPQAQPGGYYPNQGSPTGPGAAAYRAQGGGRELARRFADANVTHDGRLTREQAQAGMPLVAQNFDAIDRDQKGYVTLPEVRAFAAERRGQLGTTQ